MRNLMAAAMILALGWGAAAQAGDQPVVVELYTSQGCSSCPPADELLAELALRDDVIALSLHVDYWDYIGWKDIFGQPAHSKRQKQYARAAGARMVYTPQMIVGGIDHVAGYRPMELANLIQAHRALPDRVLMTAIRQGDKLVIRARLANGPVHRMVVQLARYSPSETVAIDRGENAGRTFTYRNVVREWATLGEWEGTGPLDMTVPAPDGPAAVIIQQAGHGPVVAAARLD